MEWELRILLSNVKKTILFFIFTTLIYIAFGFFMQIFYGSYLHDQIAVNVKEYNEVDINQMCIISNCSDVYYHNRTYEFKKDRHILTKSSDGVNHPKYIFDLNGAHFDKNLDLFVQYENIVFKIDTVLLDERLIQLYTVGIPVSVLLFVLFLLISIRSEKIKAMRLFAGNEALLSNKNMIVITENIHHELNTPIDVLSNKLEKIRRRIFDAIKEHGNREIDSEFEQLQSDFEFIEIAKTQITAVMSKMAAFKHIRYSNGNKSIYDIASECFKISSVSNDNYASFVNEKLKGYSLDSKKFSNGDLLNIFLNHIKNSLEANAFSVSVDFKRFDGKYLFIIVSDNGSGINIDNQRKIFSSNFSTKVGNAEIRGNGLFLNKTLLNACKGNVQLINSSSYGTIFEIKIPAKERKINEEVS